jgi:hypothetical protein
MTDWRALMRDGDDAPMVPERAQEIRRAVIAAVQQPASTAVAWPWSLAVAAAALMVLIGGAGDIARRAALEGDTPAAGLSGERRQVQFATPGGTRIIWELNPAFTLMETLP